MKSKEIIKEIGNLGLSEKLLLVEDIWDSIAAGNSKLPMPEWRKVELEKRYSAYKNGELQLHDWEDVHNELRNKYK